ncbi:MAG: site-specific DNA-methyltransferase, partial [candidate division Zixibacteria bacterium]|nr:site-specific DNA-methyltransferase [Candidatus Tariuqbacter arcticus]
MNKLYYGDNLEILRRHISDQSVDLIYLDPPFNSKAGYNILFKEPAGESSKAQITAFEDTWHWTEETERTYQEIIDMASANIVEMMRAFRRFINLNDMMAYLTMMCIRLIELKRVLKDTGSIYLHCDPTASHYLKILMDTVFGKKNFRNEIVWKRATMSGGKAHANQFGRNHDVLLFYTKSKINKFYTHYLPYSEEYIRKKFIYKEPDGRIYRLQPRGTRTDKAIEEFRRKGRIVESKTGYIQIKFYLDELPGVAMDDIWIDIKDIRTSQIDKLGYPTQKPITLLERIIQISSNEGDIVLDPFCGCGTSIAAAEKLNRNWIGIDITHLAVNLIKYRLKNTFELEPKKDYQVIGEPEDLPGAKELASYDRFQFQWWALSTINARPYGD